MDVLLYLWCEPGVWNLAVILFSVRPKVAINKKRYIVTPIDKRILLRTGIFLQAVYSDITFE